MTVNDRTKIITFKPNEQIGMQTPIVPLETRINKPFMTFFVPNSRLWDNAEKFSAQKTEEIKKKKEI